MTQSDPQAIASQKQKRYYRYLLARMSDAGLDVPEFIYKNNIAILKSRSEYNYAINAAKRFLAENGKPQPETQSSEKYHQGIAERREAFLQKIRSVNWFPLSARLPDRKYVRTLTTAGFYRELEWDAAHRVFVDQYGRAITEGNQQKTRITPPAYWAYLGEEGLKK